MGLVNISSDKRMFFYYGVLLLSLFSIFFTFFDEKSSRVSFFIASYISITGLIFFA